MDRVKLITGMRDRRKGDRVWLSSHSLL